MCRLSIGAFEYKLIASDILPQSSGYKRSESDLLADEKGPYNWNQLVAFVIHLFLYVYWLRDEDKFAAHYPIPKSVDISNILLSLQGLRIDHVTFTILEGIQNYKKI